MNTENNEDKVVIFNTPAGFNFEALFSGLSIKFKPKVEFLIHQINYYDFKGGYQIHSKNHKWFFGIKGTELAMMLRTLVGNGVIRLATNFTPGNTSNTYKMVRPFNIADPSTQKNFYFPHEVLFIEKWIIDSYIVKSAATSKFKKERKIANAAIITEQQKQIDDLKALISEMRGEGKSTPSTDLPVANEYPQLPIKENIVPTTSISNEGHLEVEDSAMENNQLSESLPAEEEVQVPDPHKTLSIDLSAERENLLSIVKEIKLQSQSETSTIDLSAGEERLLPTEKELQVPQPVKTLSIHLSAEDEQDLVAMFSDCGSLNTGSGINTPSTLEIFTTEQTDSIDLTPANNVEVTTDDKVAGVIEYSDVKNTFKGDTFLNGNLSIQPVDDTMCISYGKRSGCIVNFEYIKRWCLCLPDTEKQRLYYTLITSTGNAINYRLDNRTQVDFSRQVMDGGGILFRYERLIAA